MRVVGVPYVNEGEVRNIVDTLREWGGANYSDRYSFTFNQFLRVIRYYLIFNS